MRDVFAGRVRKIRDLLPFAGIGADIITGFPGETEADFEDTYSFLTDMPLSYLHVFSYSERPGTAAVALSPKVLPHEKDLRSKRLSRLSDDKTAWFCNINVGRTVPVLFEYATNGNIVSGFSGNYIRAEHPLLPDLPGQIRLVRLKEISQSGNMIVELTD
jgi:threonylcarbamoyladenosine tRNA methylthiotransferase MtaB